MLYSTKHDLENWPPRFCKCEIFLSNGNRIAFVNSRRLGRIYLFDDPTSEGPISRLGIDALNDLSFFSGNITSNLEINETKNNQIKLRNAVEDIQRKHHQQLMLLQNVKLLISKKKAPVIKSLL